MLYSFMAAGKLSDGLWDMALSFSKIKWAKKDIILKPVN